MRISDWSSDVCSSDLPQIQAGYLRGRVSGTITQFNFSGRDVSSDISYDSSNAYVQLQQTLLDYGRYAGYRRGIAVADEGAATFMARQQETGSRLAARSEEHTSELQSLMRISYAVFCLKKTTT